MRNYIAILEYEQPDEPGEYPEHGELCCLVQAESPEDVEEPLAELVERLRQQRRTLDGVKELLLLDIFELPNTPGNAVLWSTSWRYIEGTGFANVRGSMLIDDSGTGSAHAWVHEKNRADREANQPHMIEPFVRFDTTG